MNELNFQQRAVIRFLTLEGVSQLQILNRLQEIYHESALSYYQVKLWAAETKRGRESVFDEQRSGRQTTATSTGNIVAVEKLVLENRLIKVW